MRDTPSGASHNRSASSTAWLRRYFNPASPSGLRRTAVFVAALLCLVLFGVLLEIVHHTPHGALWDAYTEQVVASWRSSFLTVFFKHVTELASVGAILLLLVVSSLLLFRRHRKLIIVLAGAIGVEGAVTEVIKLLVARARPNQALSLVHETSYSFPSGHTMGAVMCWGVVAYFIGRSCKTRLARATVVAAYIVAVLLVAISRVYLGAHYPTDVVGSLLLGGGLLGISLVWLVDHPANLPPELFGKDVIRACLYSLLAVFVLTLLLPKLFI